jgi:hypothetical protein
VAVFAVTGFASLALEVVWFRMLVLFVTATTQAFAVMLAAVLTGIAAGGALAAYALRRDRPWGTVWAALLVATGIAAVASLAVGFVAYHRGWIRGLARETLTAHGLAMRPGASRAGRDRCVPHQVPHQERGHEAREGHEERLGNTSGVVRSRVRPEDTKPGEEHEVVGQPSVIRDGRVRRRAQSGD